MTYQANKFASTVGTSFALDFPEFSVAKVVNRFPEGKTEGCSGYSKWQCVFVDSNENVYVVYARSGHARIGTSSNTKLGDKLRFKAWLIEQCSK